AALSPDDLRAEIRKTKVLTRKPFAVDLLAPLPHMIVPYLPILYEEEVRIFVAGLAVPEQHVAAMKAHGMKIMVMTGKVKHAVRPHQPLHRRAREQSAEDAPFPRAAHDLLATQRDGLLEPGGRSGADLLPGGAGGGRVPRDQAGGPGPARDRRAGRGHPAPLAKEAVGVTMVAAANDPGERGDSRAAKWLLAPPSCGVPSGP